MGAWGHGSFENDHALDWCWDVRNSAQPADLVLTALSSRKTTGDEERLLAAAEIVAAAGGAAGSDDLPGAIAAWIAEGPMRVDAAMLELARTAVEAIRERSTLRELWADAGELEDWQKVVDDLLRRLRALP